MSYTKQTWTDGEIITDDKLNHMEDGIADAGGGNQIEYLHFQDLTTHPLVLDKTYGEIKALLEAGKTLILVYPVLGDEWSYTQYYMIDSFSYGDDPTVYNVGITTLGWQFLNGGLDEYPTEDEG